MKTLFDGIDYLENLREEASTSVIVINDGLRSAIAPINAPATDKFQCNVCQENCTKDPYVVPACFHSYCGDCISECLRMFGNECPACLMNGTTSTSKRDTLRQGVKIVNVSTYSFMVI